MDDLSLLRVLGSLLVVAGLIGLCAVIARWLQARGWLAAGSTASRTRRLRVVEQLPLDNRRRLLLVEKDGQELLLSLGDPVQLLDIREKTDAR